MSAFVSRLQKLSPKKGREQGEEISGKTTNTNTNRQSHKPLGRLVAPEKSRSSRAHSHSDIVYAYTDGEDESGHNVHQSSRRSSERSRKPPVKAKPHRSSQLHSLDKSRSVDTSLSDSGSVSSMPSVRTVSQRYVPGRRMSETSADSDVFEAPSPRLKHHTLDSERSVGGNKAGDGRTAGTAVSGVTPRLDWRSKPTEHWTTGDVVEWSCSLGIDKLPQIFQNAGITGTHLSNITDDILVELGLRSMVDRRKFLAEVKGVTNRKLSSLWSIKQVSMKRRDLERSTDQLYANLESLQKLNEEQEKKISSSLHEIQKEQLEAEELLSRDMTHSTDSLPAKSFPEKSKKLCDWMTADVVQWLENNNLAQFISVFQENQISGKDLDDNSLSFLDCLGGVDTEGMEALLSAIYRLQNPDPVSSQQNDLEKIQTDEDRQKYIAALQVASLEGSFSGSLMSGSTGTLSSSLTDSTSTLYVGNLTGAATHMYGSTDTLSSTQTDHTSEQPKHSIQRASPRRTNVYRKKQCASPETTSSRPKSAPVSGDSSTKWSQYATGPSLFTLLDTDKPLTLLCVKVSVHSEQLGFKVKVAQKGKVMVTHTDKNAIPLRKGDRILEACGHSMADVDSEAEFMETVRDSFILDLVITREDQERSPSKVKNDAVNSDDVVVLKNKLAQSEHQWSELRTVLEELRDLDVGSEEYLKIFPISKIEAEKDSHKLEEQLQQLQTTLTNQVTRANTLERDLDTKERSLKQAEDERDRAVTKLHQLISIIDTDSKGVAYDEIDDSVPLWENLRSADKEDVLQALKDNILESTRQKAYLDHLLGVVIDQAPYLLEELEDMEVPEEASQQTVTRNIQEEWC